MTSSVGRALTPGLTQSPSYTRAAGIQIVLGRAAFPAVRALAVPVQPPLVTAVPAQRIQHPPGEGDVQQRQRGVIPHGQTSGQCVVCASRSRIISQAASVPSCGPLAKLLPLSSFTIVFLSFGLPD